MDLADRLAAAKRQRLGIPEPAPASPTTAVDAALDLTGPKPIIDLTEPLLPLVTAAPEVAAVPENDDEPVLDDGFAATDPNAVTSWSWDPSGDAADLDGWLVADEADPDKADDELDLPDNDTWARALRDRHKR